MFGNINRLKYQLIACNREKLIEISSLMKLYHSFWKFFECPTLHAFSAICLSSFFHTLESIERHNRRLCQSAIHFCRVISKNVRKRLEVHLFLVHYTHHKQLMASISLYLSACFTVSTHILLEPFAVTF